MANRQPVSVRNLDTYGHEAMPWSRALEQLDGFNAGPGSSIWLSTTRPDGRPHMAGIGALWFDDRFWFVSGPRTQKSRNLADNPNCALAMSLPDLDLVVEGSAARVTDDATLRQLAARYVEVGWPASVKDAAFTAEYSAPSAGPPPWYLYVMTLRVAFGVSTGEPFGATRWGFDSR